MGSARIDDLAVIETKLASTGAGLASQILSALGCAAVAGSFLRAILLVARLMSKISRSLLPTPAEQPNSEEEALRGVFGPCRNPSLAHAKALLTCLLADACERPTELGICCRKACIRAADVDAHHRNSCTTNIPDTAVKPCMQPQ